MLKRKPSLVRIKTMERAEHHHLVLNIAQETEIEEIRREAGSGKEGH